MKERIYISERQPEFKIHKSLLEEPLFFETSIVRGCIFYLPSEGRFGGDSFIIRGEDYFTVSLLGDMTGHGEEGRKKLMPFIQDLERIAHIASSKKFRRRSFVREIARLDKKVDAEHMLALSFIRVLSNGSVCYLNEGENQLIVYKNRQVYNLDRISHGKIGILNVIIGDEEKIIQDVIPYNDRLQSEDRILICTDGVFDYMRDVTLIQKRKEEVEEILSSSIYLVEIIKRINKSAARGLRKEGKQRVPDDYTIIGLQLK